MLQAEVGNDLGEHLGEAGGEDDIHSGVGDEGLMVDGNPGVAVADLETEFPEHGFQLGVGVGSRGVYVVVCQVLEAMPDTTVA